MGRGKQWNENETMALVKAFIHISEDAKVGTNQSGDQLYSRVMEEAKQRYDGDWMRSPDACKKRWLDVSREVQRFCASMKFVKSVEHSGWNEDDYFKAAEEYYSTKLGDGSKKFKFINEWRFLKGYEKWKTTTTSPLKRTTDSLASSLSSSDISDSESKHISRPIGNKKQKAMAALDAKADAWMEKIGEMGIKKETTESMLKLMEDNIAQSEKNRELLQKVFEEQTAKLTHQLEKNLARVQKSTALKTLTKLDLSTMSVEFQEKARQKLESALSTILEM